MSTITTTVKLVLKCILGVFLPPILIYIEKGMVVHFWIALALTLLLFWIGGIIYAFFIVFSIEICHSIATGILPPLGLFLNKGVNIEFWICLVLTLFFWFPGMIYGYFVLSSEKTVTVA